MPDPPAASGADAPDDRPPQTAAGPGRFVVQNRQRGLAVDRQGLSGFLTRVAEDVAPGDRRGATFRIVSDRGIRELNRRYRQKDRPTDVLAFPAGPLLSPEDGPGYLGDVVVSAETALRQAERAGAGLDSELRTLAVHGLLHLLGYDHERDRGEMARLERLLRLRHGLAAGPPG